MSYTMADLITDVLPRIGNLEKPSGITIWGAATSVQSLLYKKLLDRKSDLLASGELFLVIPAYDYRVPLPADFLSMAEKPLVVEAPSWLTSTAWMAGTVTSYDSVTKTLVLNVTNSNGSGTLASWNIAIGWLPGKPINTVDTSLSSVSVGTGAKTFVTASSLSLVPGENIIISNVVLPTDSSTLSRLQPEYLNEDTNDDYSWWDEEYRYYGETYEVAATKPRTFKALGSYFFVRPKITGPIIISGTYNAKPPTLTTSTDIIPWNGLFDEVFREGTVKILVTGISIPEADPVFGMFLDRELNTVLNSRVSQVRNVGRTKKKNFM